MASSDIAAYFKISRNSASGFMRRYHVAFWLVVASTLLTGAVMRPSEVTVVILGLNVLLLWLAVGLFRRGWTSIWIVIAAEVLVATQMIPNRLTALVLLANMTLLLGALVAARIGASPQDN